MRAWVQTDRLTGLDLTTGDIIKSIQSQNVQAAVGRIGARPISDDQQLQLNIQTKGRLTSVDEFANIVIRTNPDGSMLRLGDVARLELGAANLDRETRFNGGPSAAIAIYQTPGANAIATLKAVRDTSRRTAEALPRRSGVEGDLRPDRFRHRDHSRGAEDADRSIRPCRARGLPVSRQPARDADPDLGGAGEPDRHLYRAQCDRLLRQYCFAAGHRSGDRHRRRRRDRRRRECRANNGGASRAVARRRGEARDGRDHRADYRDHARVVVGVRAGRVHSRHFRRTVPPIRRDRRRLDVSLGDQRVDAVSRALCGVFCGRITGRVVGRSAS